MEHVVTKTEARCLPVKLSTNETELIESIISPLLLRIMRIESEEWFRVIAAAHFDNASVSVVGDYVVINLPPQFGW